MIKACLNGDRTRRQHRPCRRPRTSSPGPPPTPWRPARPWCTCTRATRRGRETLETRHVVDAVAAIRAATPGLRVSVSTRDGIVDRPSAASSPTCRSGPHPTSADPTARASTGTRTAPSRSQRRCATTGSGSRPASGRPRRPVAFVGTSWPWQVERVLVELIPGVTPGVDGTVGRRAHPRRPRHVAGARARARRGARGPGRCCAGLQAAGLRRAHRPGGHPLPARRERGARQRRARRRRPWSPSRARRRSGRCPTRSEPVSYRPRRHRPAPTVGSGRVALSRGRPVGTACWASSRSHAASARRSARDTGTSSTLMPEGGSARAAASRPRSSTRSYAVWCAAHSAARSVPCGVAKTRSKAPA